MPGSIYKRNTFIPVKSIAQDFITTVQALDLYAARYNGAFRAISSFSSYQVTDDDESRLDIISNRAYGTPDLWWVIGIYNGIINPLVEVETGMYLRIPPRQQVEFILQNKANDSSSFSFPTASASGAVTVELR